MTTPAAFRVPQISKEELYAFHEAHFSRHSIADFKSTFLHGKPNASQSYGFGAIELSLTNDGGLPQNNDIAEHHGTLDDTDAYEPTYEPFEAQGEILTAHGEDDGEVFLEINVDGEDEQKKSQRKKRRRKVGANTKWAQEKPDLRKRTWDIVDTGLNSLDYDGLESGQPSLSVKPQRQCIRYEDD